MTCVGRPVDTRGSGTRRKIAGPRVLPEHRLPLGPGSLRAPQVQSARLATAGFHRATPERNDGSRSCAAAPRGAIRANVEPRLRIDEIHTRALLPTEAGASQPERLLAAAQVWVTNAFGLRRLRSGSSFKTAASGAEASIRQGTKNKKQHHQPSPRNLTKLPTLSGPASGPRRFRAGRPQQIWRPDLKPAFWE